MQNESRHGIEPAPVTEASRTRPYTCHGWLLAPFPDWDMEGQTVIEPLSSRFPASPDWRRHIDGIMQAQAVLYPAIGAGANGRYLLIGSLCAIGPTDARAVAATLGRRGHYGQQCRVGAPGGRHWCRNVAVPLLRWQAGARGGAGDGTEPGLHDGLEEDVPRARELVVLHWPRVARGGREVGRDGTVAHCGTDTGPSQDWMPGSAVCARGGG